MSRTWDDIARRADGVEVETPNGSLPVSIESHGIAMSGARSMWVASCGSLTSHQIVVCAMAELRTAREERDALRAELVAARAKAALLDEWRAADEALTAAGEAYETYEDRSQSAVFNTACKAKLAVERRMREASHG